MKNRKQAITIALLILIVVAYTFLFRRNDTYLTPEIKCLSSDAPTWCPDEYSMAYSSSAANELDHTFYNEETGLCNDGTRDCVYIEKYNDQRILQGVFNGKNVELGQKFLDDVYAGNLTISEETIAQIKEGIKFENGVMKFKNNPQEDTFDTVKVGFSTAEETRQLLTQGIVVIPPSLFLLYLAIYFRFNNLPKPTLRYELKSLLSMAQLRALPPTAPAPAPAPTPTPQPQPQTNVG